ncbi:DUF1559 domain-containing protein [Durusdinium trenchii]|uniref:DUF1559 domain-containing protein n=1 Tax=Durusdinium trenchii TaxID=1381693 RepID=A0ABP0JQ96_9DINO
MVLIDPPPDWVPPRSISVPSPDKPIVAVTTDSSSGTLGSTPADESKPSPAPATPSPKREKPKQKKAHRPKAKRPKEKAATQQPEVDEEDSADTPSKPIYLSPVEQLGRRLTLLMIIPAATLVAFTIYWTISSASSPPPAAPQPQDIAAGDVEEPVAVDDAEEAEPQPATPPEFDVRWMPQGTTYALRIGSPLLRPLATARVVVEGQLPGLWPQLEPLLSDLDVAGIPVASVQWAGVTPGQWDRSSLIVLRLGDAAEETETWFATGQETDTSVGKVTVRTFAAFEWPHPLALVEPQTLVTGTPESLAASVAPGTTESLSPELSELLSAETPTETSLASLYRFVATVPKAGSPNFVWLPAWITDEPVVEETCKPLTTTPEVVDIRIGAETPPKLSIALGCADEAAVNSLEETWLELFAALNEHWRQEVATVEQQQASALLSAAEADQVRGVFSQALSAIQTGATTRDGLTIVTTFQLPGSVSDIASSFTDSEPGRFRFRELILTEGDLKNQQTIIKGLKTAADADKQWPLGAAGAVQLRAETRLSWIASTLPFMEGGEAFEEMHRQLNFFRSWNDPANLEVTRRPLALFTNPRLGPSKTPAGFPTTNYVGVAGLGGDAASLDPADPRAGVFNNRYRVALEDIKDGGSQTIAVLGVTDRLGPWASGGDATVRPLTIQPYIDGPDHFGSGMQGGMFAGMADGSVRFIADDIDPRVLEQLVTINSGPLEPGQIELSLKPATLPLQADQPGDLASTAPEEPSPEVPAAESDSIEYDQTEIEKNAAVVIALEGRLPAIDFTEVSLDDFIEFMAQLTAVNIDFDLEAMSEAGASPEDQLSVRLRDASYGEVLNTALASLGLGFIIQDGQLQITTPAKQAGNKRVAIYPIADLCGDDEEGCESLAAMILSLITPNTWSTTGGESRLQVEGENLVVESNEYVHHQLASFLAKLRLARGIELADGPPAEEVTLFSRAAKAFEAMQTPVNIRINEPTPLTDILSRLQRTTGVNLLIDTPALDAAGVTPDVETSLQASGVTLAQALGRLCDSLELTFRVINSHTVELTTPTAAEGRLEIEFYPVEALLQAGTTADELIIKIKETIAPQSWRQTGGPAAIYFDEPSNCLIVLQTQGQQMQIELLLHEDPSAAPAANP